MSIAAVSESSAPAADTQDRRVYMSEDVARMFGISLQTVYAWIDRGSLPRPLKLGKALMWPRESIDALLK